MHDPATQHEVESLAAEAHGRVMALAAPHHGALKTANPALAGLDLSGLSQTLTRTLIDAALATYGPKFRAWVAANRVQFLAWVSGQSWATIRDLLNLGIGA
jgi:hypothetical protein